MNRRRFCRIAGGWMAAGAVGSLLRSPYAIAAEPDARFPAGRYVDVHVHIDGVKAGTNVPLTVDDLLRWMDANHVAQACVLPLVSPEAFPNPVSSELVLERTKPHRDRLIPFCAIDPRNSWLDTPKALVDKLKLYIDQGAKGFGEHKPGVAITDPRNMAIFEGCQQVGLPVLFHLDPHRNIDVPGLPGLRTVLKTFPEATFIGHATGFWSSIAGGPAVDLGRYQEGKVAPGGALVALFDTFPNLYGDLSAYSGFNAINRDPEFGREFLIRRADRLMFGTDYLTPDQDIHQFELYERLALPEDVQRKIFRDNARRVIKIGGAA